MSFAKLVRLGGIFFWAPLPRLRAALRFAADFYRNCTGAAKRGED